MRKHGRIFGLVSGLVLLAALTSLSSARTDPAGGGSGDGGDGMGVVVCSTGALACINRPCAKPGPGSPGDCVCCARPEGLVCCWLQNPGDNCADHCRKW